MNLGKTRQRQRKTARAVVVAAVIAGVAAAAGSPNTQADAFAESAAAAVGSSAASSVVTWGLKQNDATNLDPFLYYDQTSFIDWLVYDSLTESGPRGTVVPRLATSWKQTGPTTWVFQLRRGVRFSNGRELVANDVVTSFRLVMKDTYSFLFAPGRTATAVGKYAVKFGLTQPSSAFPAQVENLLVLPAKEIRSGSFDRTKQTLGTGPYMAKSHVPNVSWTFTANPHYWRKGYPKIRTVVVRLFSDEATLDSALRAGTVDFEQTSNIDAARALAGKKIKVQTVPTPDFYYIAMNALNPSEPEFKDRRVRQAVNLAINRPQIAQVALAGAAKLTGMPPSAFSDGCDVSKMPGAKPDLTKARALMKAAGVENITTTLYISPNTGAFAAPQIAQVVKQNLSQIGINANIQTVDVPTWVDVTFTKSTFSMTVNWWTGFGDPTLRPTSWQPAVAGYVKGFMQDDPTLDAWIKEAGAAPRSNARTAIFQQICQRIANNANVVPLVSKDLPVAYRSDRVVPVFANFEPNAFPWRYIWKYTLVGKR